MPAIRSWKGYIKRLHPEHSFTADSLAIMDSIICDLCCKICSAAMMLVKANDVKTVVPDTAKLAVNQVMHSSASRKGFPAHRVMRCLKEIHGAERVSAKTPAIIAGALAHACHSICSLANKITQEDGRQRIQPKDVLRSVHQLREKKELPVDGIIAAAGVIGQEQPKKRKPAKRKSAKTTSKRKPSKATPKRKSSTPKPKPSKTTPKRKSSTPKPKPSKATPKRKSSTPKPKPSKTTPDSSSWTIIKKQLGKSGKEGTVLMAYHDKSNTLGAAKTFRKTKAQSTMRKEYDMMALAAQRGVAPNVYAFDYPKRLYIMERMDKTLPEILKGQNGVLTKAQQLRIIELYDVLDEVGLYHGDPNPLNVMTDMNGQLRLIDFGFSKMITPKLKAVFGSKPNTISIYSLLFSPLQGLVSTGKLRQKPTTLISHLRKNFDDTRKQMLDDDLQYYYGA